MTFLKLSLTVLLTGFLGSTHLIASEDMPLAQNLYLDGQEALQKNIPIAILLNFKGLKSTENLKEEALYPNLLSGVFDGKVLFREIEVNVANTLIDFYNEPLEAKEFQGLFNVTSLPALVFVDGHGEQIVPPLLSGSYDYYGFYLKRELDKAMQHLGNPTRFSD